MRDALCMCAGYEMIQEMRDIPCICAGYEMIQEMRTFHVCAPDTK